MKILRQRADVRTLIFVAAYFVLLCAVWLNDPRGVAGQLLSVGLLGYFAFTCAVITHNTIHTPMFHSRGLNRFFQVVLTLSYGHPVSAYVPGHNLSHHVHTQTSRDVMRTTKARFRWNLLNQLLFVVVVGRSITKADFTYAKAMRGQRPRWWRQWLIETGAMIAVTGGLLVLDWRRALLYFVIPHAIAAWGIIGINYAQHDGCDEAHPQNHSRNFVGGVANWLLFNNGYHAIHHMKPTLHWSKLPAAHAELVAPYNHDNLDQASMPAYFWRAYFWPGRRLDYLGESVVLPERVEDESWIPERDELSPGTSLGAES